MSVSVLVQIVWGCCCAAAFAVFHSVYLASTSLRLPCFLPLLMHMCWRMCSCTCSRVSVPVCACVCVHVCVPPQVTITDASVIFQRVGEAEFSENSPRLCMRFALDMHALTLASPRACARRLS